jgi:hypothetical protein
MSLNEHFIIFSSSNVIIINIMTREIEIEILDQSDIIFRNMLKNKKRDVQKLINDLFSISSNYTFISISFRKLTSHEKLLLKSQISLTLFQLLFCSFVLQIMINHINMKTHLKRIEVFMHAKSWRDITSAKIEAFVEILLYMSILYMSRTIDYWNLDSIRTIHALIVNCMSSKRWKQIKRYLKISNLINDQKMNTKKSDWWKKLNWLIIQFRITSKKYWTSDNHVSINEQLINYRERFVHTMQLTCKTTEVDFKLYHICQNNYFIDFLFIFKIWNRNIKYSDLKCWHFDLDS